MQMQNQSQQNKCLNQTGQSSNLSCHHLAYQDQLIFLNQFTLVTKIIASCLGELQKQGCPAKCRHHSRPVSKFIILIATKP